eukprot:9573279-Ditylum_brightwellii.AAC.1
MSSPRVGSTSANSFERNVSRRLVVPVAATIVSLCGNIPSMKVVSILIGALMVKVSATKTGDYFSKRYVNQYGALALFLAKSVKN